MAKEAYYFSHDSNARTDPKILEMRSVYKAQGYGWYWMIVEMMRDQEDYALSMQGKYVWNAFASQLDATAEEIKAFIEDCISEFKLFESDGAKFWSKSLLQRMKTKEEKSEKARKSAEARWNKHSKEANEMQPQCDSNANASKNDAIKESKVKEIKIKYADYVSMTEDEYNKLIQEYGQTVIKNKITDLNLWKGSKGKKTKSDYMTILAWIRKDNSQLASKVVNLQQDKPNRANSAAYDLI